MGGCVSCGVKKHSALRELLVPQPEGVKLRNKKLLRVTFSDFSDFSDPDSSLIFK